MSGKRKLEKETDEEIHTLRFKALSFSISSDKVERFIEELNKTIDKYTTDKASVLHRWYVED